MEYGQKILQIQNQVPEAQKSFVSQRKYHSCIFSTPSKQDFLIHCSCVQGWFTRSSWLAKVDFLRKLIDASRPFIIEMLRAYVFIGKTKDIIYTCNETMTQYFYDRIVHDDNRTLEEVSLKLARSSDLEWYSNLSSTQQYRLLINLFRISGGYVMKEIYEHLKRNRMTCVSSVSQVGLINFIDQESICEKTASSGNSKSNLNLPMTPELESMYRQWNNQLNDLRYEIGGAETTTTNKKRNRPKSAVSDKSTSKRKKADQKSVLDMVQMFPLWINRKILSYFNAKELAVLKDVNMYWRNMVEDVLALMRFKAKFDKKIRKLKIQAVMRTAEVHNSIYHDLGTPKFEKKDHFDSVKPPQRRQKLRKILKRNKPLSLQTYHRYFTVKLLHCYDLTRRTAISDKFRIFAITSLPHDITIFSLISGMPVRHFHINPIRQKGPITSVAIYDKDGFLLSGMETGMIVCWHLWKFDKLNTYYGHSNAVTIMEISGNLLISVSIQKIMITDMPIGLQKVMIKIHVQICAIATMVDGDVFFAAFQNGELIKYTTTGAFVEGVQAHIGACTSAKCSSMYLITGGLDTFVRVWNLSDLSNGCLLEIEHRSAILCVNLFGAHIFAGSKHGVIYVWNIDKEKLVRNILVGNFRNPIRQIYFSSTKLQRCQLVIARDLDVHVIEFYQTKPRKHVQKTSTRPYVLTHQGTNITSLPEPEPGVDSMNKARQTRSYYRMETLLWRGCTDPILRGRVCPPNSTRAVLTNAIHTYNYFHEATNRAIEFFPRCLIPANDTTFIPNLAAPKRFVKLATIPAAELAKRYGNKSLIQVLHPYRVTI